MFNDNRFLRVAILSLTLGSMSSAYAVSSGKEEADDPMPATAAASMPASAGKVSEDRRNHPAIQKFLTELKASRENAAADAKAAEALSETLEKVKASLPPCAVKEAVEVHGWADRTKKFWSNVPLENVDEYLDAMQKAFYQDQQQGRIGSIAEAVVAIDPSRLQSVMACAEQLWNPNPQEETRGDLIRQITRFSEEEMEIYIPAYEKLFGERQEDESFVQKALSFLHHFSSEDLEDVVERLLNVDRSFRSTVLAQAADGTTDQFHRLMDEFDYSKEEYENDNWQHFKLKEDLRAWYQDHPHVPAVKSARKR